MESLLEFICNKKTAMGLRSIRVGYWGCSGMGIKRVKMGVDWESFMGTEEEAYDGYSMSVCSCQTCG